MTQTLAIFHDAYRSLNAKKMFWAVLLISLLVVAAFALLSINERGLKVFIWQLDTKPLTSETISAETLFKWCFVEIGISIWLGWIATILALISTAGIFPDLITSGSIDLLVSKPIGRLRLFLTQYMAGLLFVTLQVTVFTAACFLVIGVRGGAWEPGLFIAVPLLVCFFSYLFSVCVFFGMVTRSTLAALLLTLLFWFGVYGLGAAENALLMFKTMEERGVSLTDPPGRGPSAEPAPAGAPESVEQTDTEPLLNAAAPDEAEQPVEPEEKRKGPSSLAIAHKIVYNVKTCLPKTTETVALLERTLIDMAELKEGVLGQPNANSPQAQASREFVESIRQRSVWWVVGTSLCFEALVLAWGAFIFCRRDY